MKKTINDLENEVWKEIPNYEGIYEISSLGRIKSFAFKNNPKWKFKSIDYRILSPKLDYKGYETIGLHKDHKKKIFKIHRMVGQVFIPNPTNLPQINHKDGNKRNNIVSNLEWTDNSGNQKHAWDLGLQVSRAGLPGVPQKLTKEDIIKIRDKYNKGYTQQEIANQFGVCRQTIQEIVTNKIWTHV